jgi:hypothetical protein
MDNEQDWGPNGNICMICYNIVVSSAHHCDITTSFDFWNYTLQLNFKVSDMYEYSGVTVNSYLPSIGCSILVESKTWQVRSYHHGFLDPLWSYCDYTVGRLAHHDHTCRRSSRMSASLRCRPTESTA